MLNVTIIDKRPVIQFGLKFLLESKYEGLTVSDFESLESYFVASPVPRADIILIGTDGYLDLELGKRLGNLKKSQKESRVVVYDTSSSIDLCIKYIRCGAQGYLSISSDFKTIRDCIEAVKNGKIYIDPTYQANLIEGLINKKWSSVKKSYKPSESLTTRQSEIAVLFANGMSTSRIAKKLGLQSSTVSTVKSTIYAKLKVDSIVDLSKKVSSGEWNF